MRRTRRGPTSSSSVDFLDIGADLERRFAVVIAQGDGVNFAT